MVNPVSSFGQIGSTWVPTALYYFKFQGHSLLVPKKEIWRCLPCMGLEAILVIWPGTFEHIFAFQHPIGAIPLELHIKFDFKWPSVFWTWKKKFENVKAKWPWTKVSERLWPSIVINQHVLINLTIRLYTYIHLTGFNSVLEIYNLSIFPYKNLKGTKFDLAVK